MVANERVAFEVAEGVAHVALARPDKRNALDIKMFEAIAETLSNIERRDDLRAVVLSGQGRSFCAGIDLACLPLLAVPDGYRRLVERSHGDMNLFQFCALGWRRLPVPVIAALHGAVFGGGLQIALGADVRIGSSDTELSIMEIRKGLVPDMGATVLLEGLVREDLLRELIFSGRRIAADEGCAIGLMSSVKVDPLGAARELAKSIAQLDPEAVRAAKRLANSIGVEPISKRLQAESVEQVRLIQRIAENNRRDAISRCGGSTE
jgi:enoyl-CoA hydratase/carnithine racemase